MDAQAQPNTETGLTTPETPSAPREPTETSSPKSKGSRGMSLLFLAVIGGAIAVPQFLNRPQPTPPQVVAIPQATGAAPVAVPSPIPIQPSNDDLVKTLNEAIASAQSDWDLYIMIRADAYLTSAKAADSADEWLLKECSKLTTEYQQLSWKQSTFEGTAKDAERIRTLLGDSLACLVAVRRLREGEAATGRAIQPQPYLDKVRIALGVYASKIGVNTDALVANQPDGKGSPQPPNNQPVGTPPGK